MYKVLSLLLLIILFSCISNEHKAKKLIKDELFKTLHDFGSYEPVEFSKIDSVFSDYTMDTMYIRCKIINEEAKSQYEIVGNRVRDNRGKAYGEAFEKWKDDLKSAFVFGTYSRIVFPNIEDSIKYNFESKLLGLSIIHKYRSKTLGGNFKLSEAQYIFNPDFTRIVMSHIIDEKNLPIGSPVKNLNERERVLVENLDYKIACEKYLEDNKIKDGVITTKSGLQYKIITKGNGKVPTLESNAIIKCKSFNIYGERKDKGDKPFRIGLKSVAPWLKEALCLMPKGSIWEIYVSCNLANKDKGNDDFKPFSTIIWEMELVDVLN